MSCFVSLADWGDPFRLSSILENGLEIIDNKALLLKLRNPNKITTVIPKSKQVGEHEVLVNWGLDEAQVLKNLQIKNIPSPIVAKYDWPGMYKPFDHQKTTASFLTLHRRAFCLNEQGTGKTGSVIWAADYLMKLGKIKRVLVICPLSIMDSAWRADLFKFAMHRTVDIAYGDRHKRARIINSDAEFIIINYDGVEIVQEAIANGGFDLIVIDEANAYKNAQTTRWKTLSKILKPDTWLWMLTGTPAAQSPVDAYGLAKLVNPSGVPKFFTSFKDMEFDIKNRYKVLREVIDETQQKILIFVPFKHTIEILSQKLQDDGFTTDIINGDVSAQNRADIFKRFQETPNPRVLIIQPQAAAHGVTLTAADTVIWWGPTPSLETYAQANARAHRAGQRHPVTVVRLEGSNAEKHLYKMLDARIDDHVKLVELYKNLLD